MKSEQLKELKELKPYALWTIINHFAHIFPLLYLNQLTQNFACALHMILTLF